MTLGSPMRATLVVAIAVAYLAAALCVAGTSTVEPLAPLSRAVTIAVPLGAGLLCALAPSRSHPGLAIAAAIGVVTLAGSAAITAGWLPIAWFAFAGAWIGGAAVIGGIAGSFLAVRRAGPATVGVVALAIPFVALLETAPDRLGDEEVTTRVEVLAPAHELWEEIIGADSLAAPSNDSTTVRADNPIRVVEWEDAERLRVVSGPRVLVAPRGVAAWRAGWGEGAVLQAAAAYDIVARGDTSTLTITSRYRMHLHPRAYPAGWVANVATARVEALAASFRERAERRIADQVPALTAEMQTLRGYLVEEFAKLAAEERDLHGVFPGFINVERRIELADPSSLVPGTFVSPAERRREALLLSADAARTTGSIAPLGAEAGATQADSVELRFEDYLGRCVAEVAPVVRNASGEVSLGTPRRSRCEMDVMARRAARSRLIAELPLSAGEAGDRWSIPLIARGITRVYADSIVVRADTLRFKATPADGNPQQADSISFGLSRKTERAWYLSRRGSHIPIGRSFAKDEEWVRTRVRFSVPADSTVDLTLHWPTFQAVISLPKTAENPYGTAWTYAHAPMAYFNGIKRE